MLSKRVLKLIDWHKYARELLDWIISQAAKEVFSAEEEKFLLEKVEPILADALRLVEAPRT